MHLSLVARQNSPGSNITYQSKKGESTSLNDKLVETDIKLIAKFREKKAVTKFPNSWRYFTNSLTLSTFLD